MLKKEEVAKNFDIFHFLKLLEIPEKKSLKNRIKIHRTLALIAKLRNFLCKFEKLFKISI